MNNLIVILGESGTGKSTSLRNLDPMYDFSLESFIRTFRKSIKSAEKPLEKKNIR